MYIHLVREVPVQDRGGNVNILVINRAICPFEHIIL